MDTQNSETLRARAQALADIPALLKPFTQHGTKLRVPKDIGDTLISVHKELDDMLSSVHYEDVHYDYQDEPEAEQPPDVLKAAGKPFQAASDCIAEGRALAALMWNDEVDEHVSRAAQMLFERMNAAAKQLNSLWVAIGGTSAPEFVRPDGTVDTGEAH